MAISLLGHRRVQSKQTQELAAHGVPVLLHLGSVRGSLETPIGQAPVPSPQPHRSYGLVWGLTGKCPQHRRECWAAQSHMKDT